MARDYAPLLAAAHVDVLFSGHDHIYERGMGTTPEGKLTYVVTGGGGAPLYNPSLPRAERTARRTCRVRCPPCPASVAVLTNSYHYLMVEVAARRASRSARVTPTAARSRPACTCPPHGGHRFAFDSRRSARR